MAGSHELGIDVQCRWGHKSQSYRLQRKFILYFFYHARSVRFSICRIRQVLCGLSLLTLVDVGLLCTKLSVKPFPCLISLKRLLNILPEIKIRISLISMLSLNINCEGDLGLKLILIIKYHIYMYVCRIELDLSC